MPHPNSAGPLFCLLAAFPDRCSARYLFAVLSTSHMNPPCRHQFLLQTLSLRNVRNIFCCPMGRERHLKVFVVVNESRECKHNGEVSRRWRSVGCRHVPVAALSASPSAQHSQGQNHVFGLPELEEREPHRHHPAGLPIHGAYRLLAAVPTGLP